MESERISFARRVPAGAVNKAVLDARAKAPSRMRRFQARCTVRNTLAIALSRLPVRAQHDAAGDRDEFDPAFPGGVDRRSTVETRNIPRAIAGIADVFGELENEHRRTRIQCKNFGRPVAGRPGAEPLSVR